MSTLAIYQQVAEKLAALYEASFGGKSRGRFRISMKLMCELAGRRRLYEDDRRAISRELFELGYVLIDMETYFAILSQRTLRSYRRANADQLHPDLRAARAPRKLTGERTLS
jgi:hypothetical protein